ncbi:MAG: large conductance mechanosensitive channel [Frankiaceae bacterium]|nr:large conductance mechanosensitive channel [Frankiaceae bacterium]
MVKGFRDFIMRGNIVDLAIAVVIGVAFTALVAAVTDSLIKPLIGVFLGGGVSGGTFTVRGQVFNVGAVITAIITFLITAAVVYFLIVVPMKNADRRARGDADVPTPAPSDEAVLLTEIRDLLARRAV